MHDAGDGAIGEQANVIPPAVLSRLAADVDAVALGSR
jgi:hypothetical protein